MHPREARARQETLRTSARCLRLLGKVKLAEMLEDGPETGRMQTLLDQVSLVHMEELALQLELEARLVMPSPVSALAAEGTEL